MRDSRPSWPPSRAGTSRCWRLFDHEEVGSTSDHGAQSDLLPTTLERITLAAGGGREDFLRRLAGSMVASGDMAHATHPNYPERHEPGHWIEVNAGPVLKVQPNLRYATDSRTAAAFELACRQAGVPLQRYEHRADLPCGSTIGPMTSARTGIPTVDVGAAQLAMHSARELMGCGRRRRVFGCAAGVSVAGLTAGARWGCSLMVSACCPRV